MGFAYARGSVDEQGVIGSAWVFDHSLSGGEGQIVGEADDEVFQGVFEVEVILGGWCCSLGLKVKVIITPLVANLGFGESAGVNKIFDLHLAAGDFF